jgi:hypothetical protein
MGKTRFYTWRIRTNNGRITSRVYKTPRWALAKVRRCEATGEDFLLERGLTGCRWKTLAWWTPENQRGMAAVLREFEDGQPD